MGSRPRDLRRSYVRVSAVMAGTAVAALSACATASASSVSAHAASAEPNVTLRLASYQPTGDPWNVWAQQLANEVSKGTHGHVKIKIFPNSELGTNADSLTAAASGSVDLTLSAPQLEDVLAPGLDVPFLPGLFETTAQASDIVNSTAVLDITQQALKPHHLQQLSDCYTGPLAFVSTKPLPSVASIKGVNIRVPDTPNSQLVEALGGVPVIIAESEAYTALETGEVEAAATDVPAAISNKYYAVAKYLNLAPLSGTFETLLINTKSLAKLSAAEQDVLTTDALNMQDSCTASFVKAGTAAIKQWKANGGVTVADPANYAAYAKAFAPLLKKGEAATAISRKLADAINAAIGKS